MNIYEVMVSRLITYIKYIYSYVILISSRQCLTLQNILDFDILFQYVWFENGAW